MAFNGRISSYNWVDGWMDGWQPVLLSWCRKGPKLNATIKKSAVKPLVAVKKYCNTEFLGGNYHFALVFFFNNTQPKINPLFFHCEENSDSTLVWSVQRASQWSAPALVSVVTHSEVHWLLLGYCISPAFVFSLCRGFSVFLASDLWTGAFAKCKHTRAHTHTQTVSVSLWMWKMSSHTPTSVIVECEAAFL